jgi:two-component system chemotaxis response regulator CheB
LENLIDMSPQFSVSFDAEDLGAPTGFSCPDCSGTLMQTGAKTYRCRVGHAWTAGGLLLAHDEEFQQALWVAIRNLEERFRLSRQLAESSGTKGDRERYRALADKAKHTIRLLGDRPLGVDETG